MSERIYKISGYRVHVTPLTVSIYNELGDLVFVFQSKYECPVNELRAHVAISKYLEKIEENF